MVEHAEARPAASWRGRLSAAWDLIRELRHESRDDALADAAASVAFWLLLSLPAATLALLASLSLLGPGLAEDLQGAVDDLIDRTFTTEAQGLRDAVDGVFDQQRPGLFSFSIAVALFTASRGFAGLIRALDVAYDIEESRGVVRLRLTAVGLALGTFAMIAASTLLWVRSGELGLPQWLRLIAALLVLVVWSATMFHLGPHHRTPWRYDVPGAIVAALGWLLLSLAFGWYVRFAGSGNELVGAASTALLALTWLWAACVVFLVGAEINEIIADRADAIRAPRTYAHVVQKVRENVTNTIWSPGSSDERDGEGRQ